MVTHNQMLANRVPRAIEMDDGRISRDESSTIKVPLT